MFGLFNNKVKEVKAEAKGSTLADLMAKDKWEIVINGTTVTVNKYDEPTDEFIIKMYEDPYNTRISRSYINYILKELGYSHYYIPGDIAIWLTKKEKLEVNQWIINRYNEIKGV